RSTDVLVVIQEQQGNIEQDNRVTGYAHEEANPNAIVVNKSDAVDKETNTMKKFKDEVRKEFKFIDYAQIAFVSAKQKKRLSTLFPYITEASENHKKRVQSSTLNEVITDAISMN